MKILKYIVVISVGLLLLSTNLFSEQPHGTFKAGYIFTDEQGNDGVYQPTYNMFEGAAVSLEDFSYRLKDGTRVFGDFTNVTLNNRKMNFGGTKAGLFNVRLSHNQYRRTYSFDGDKTTRRENSYGTLWIQPVKYIRVFGGFGWVDKQGESPELFEPTTRNISTTNYDYRQKYYNAGAKFSYEGSHLELEFRGSDFDDDLNPSNLRNTRQFRVAGSSPLPQVKNLYVNGGYQRYELEIENIDDTLTANIGWGGLRYYHKDGYFAKYSFVWDRSRRTTDPIATDNITNAIYIGREWLGKGGLTVGYRHRINDDFFDELSTKGYYLSCWLKANERLTLRGGFGAENTVVEAGRTVTGDKDYTRVRASATYKFKYGTWRARVQNKKTDNDDIGSTAEYLSLGTDVTVSFDKYGELIAAYDFLSGEYVNTDGTFEFNDHVLWGNVLSKRYMNYQLGFSGTYVRSKQDVDIESFSLRISANYLFQKVYKFEVAYTAHNFDDLNDRLPLYTRYYTANVVEIFLSRDF